MRQFYFRGGAVWATMAATVSIFLGATAAVSASELGGKAEEAIPDADNRLMLTELRWCTFELVRLDGSEGEASADVRWEIDELNARVRAYNDHCSNKTYNVKDKTAVEGELTPAQRQTLRQAGVAHVRQARIEREQRRIFVKDQAAAVHALPGHVGEELGRVKRWGELVRTGRVQGPWYEVEWRRPRLETALKFGWVLGGLVEHGSGGKARFDYCEAHAGRRAEHSEIVRGRTQPDRAGSIRVNNGTDKDAYVKLVNRQGRVALSFLAEAGQTAALKGIPLGSFEVMFATGSKFSRGCDSFSIRGAASKFTRRIDYRAHTGGWTLSLNVLSDGNARVNSVSYDEFDKF